TKQAISPSLLHGLGQSYTENTKRTAADTALLGSLSTSPDATAQLARGLSDGIPYLKSTEKLRAWRAAIGILPFWPEVVGRIFEVASAHAERACDLTSLLDTDPRPSLPYQPYSRILEACAEAIGKKKVTDPSVAPRLSVALGKLDAKGDERLAR